MCNTALLLKTAPKRRPCKIFLLWLLLVLFPLLKADELRLTGERALTGIFLGISDRGLLSFQVYGQEGPDEFPAGKVVEIKLDKPVKARFFQKQSKKKGRPGIFIGMHKERYRLQFTGEPRVQEISRMQLHKLEVELDMKDYMVRMEKQRLLKAEKLAGRKADAREFLVPDRVVILHFTSPKLAANSRQGNLAQRLCEGSSRPAQYVQILVDSLESSIARENALDSLPQFWFYTARSRLNEKLTGRFTDEDIGTAFLKAGKE